MVNDPEPPVETDPTGRFTRFRSILGRGAYKTVYRAFDTDEALEVAWNKLHVERLSKHELEKVSNEVELLKRVYHKNIIRFYHTWTNPAGNGAQTIDFITEQMTSGTLKEYLKKARAIKLKVIRRWCSNILEAIAYLHAQHPPIMHRDLKCENIFINGHVGEVKIGDLGLSGVKVRDKADSVIGTPEFMAPELYEESYTEKVDIYAFGMCLLEMVAMEYPYSECTNLAQIFKKVYNDERPKAFDRIVECDVKNVIAACLRREASRPSAAELLQHPLFMNWQEDDGKETNLSLLRRSGDGLGSRAASSRSNGTEGYGANVIDWSDQLDRTVLVSMPDGEAGQEVEQGANVSVVASQANENGGFMVGLQIPFGDKIKGVQFTFDPFKDNPRHIAQEMVNEFHLAADQLIVIEEEVERQVRSAREQREAASRNATPQHVGRNALSSTSNSVSGEKSMSGAQPIEALRTAEVPEAVAAPHAVQSQSETGLGSDVISASSGIVETGTVENYPTNDTSVPQAHADIIPPPSSVPEQMDPQNGNQEEEYHRDLRRSETTHQTIPSDSGPPSVIPSSNASDSGYYSGAAHDQEQSTHFQIPEKGINVDVEAGIQSRPQQMTSMHHEAQEARSTVPQNPNGTLHEPHQIGIPTDEPLPYSQIASSLHGNASQDYGQRSTGHASGSEHSIAPQVSSHLPPAHTESPMPPPTYVYAGSEGMSRSGEFLNRQSPPRSTHSLTFAEPLQQGKYSDNSTSQHAESVLQQQEETHSRSAGSGHYNVLPPTTSAPIPSIRNDGDRSTPAAIPHSASEQLHGVANQSVESNSPHRSISAPAGTITIDDSADFLGQRHGVSPMPVDMVPVLTPNLQSLAADENLVKVLPTGMDQRASGQSGTSSMPSSRPPSIVVVGGERRSSSREKRHTSGPSLSAKSLPEYNRPEGSRVPRSASLMSNVAEVSKYPGPGEKDVIPVSGHASASPSAISRRSSSWRSSQSDESNTDVALRSSTSDSTLGVSLDQRGLAACLELMEHCAKGRYSSVLQKLDQGTPAQFADYDKRTPLHLASARGHIEVCMLLLERGANVSARDRWGRSPLSDAKSNEQEAVVDLLKKHGAVEDLDMSSDIASLQLLQYAAKGDLEAVRGRLIAGASATYADYDQRTALHLACTEGHEEVAELLLVNNADPEAVDSRGRTPVDDAVAYGHRNILRVLRQYGAEIPKHLMGSHSDSHYQLGLDLVEHAAKGRSNAIRKCLRNGANPNFQDHDKRTPLHLAAVEGNIDIVEILLQAGASGTIRDRWGATARDGALKEQRTAVVDELDNWGKRMAEKNAPFRDVHNVANGRGGRRSHSLNIFNTASLGGPDGERIVPAPSASLGSFAMHPDMFVEKYPSSASKAPVVDVLNMNPPPPVQTPATFERQNEGNCDIDEQERMLQAEYNEKLRRLRESRSASQIPKRKSAPTVQASSSAGTRRHDNFPATGTASTSTPSIAVPRATSPLISEAPSVAAVAAKRHDYVDRSVSGQAVERQEGVQEDKAEELASEIVDDIIDVVVQDSSESEGNVM